MSSGPKRLSRVAVLRAVRKISGSLAARLSASIIPLAAVGCAAEAHPTEAAAASPAVDMPTNGPTSTDDIRCAALATRECRMYTTDASGQLNCPTSFQICKADGTGWLACGRFQIGPDGLPEPMAAP
jgi:hypothetical protein